MKTHAKFLLLFLIIGPLTNVYADHPAHARSLGQQIDGAVVAIEEFTQEKKGKTIKQVDNALNKLDTRIDELERKLDKKWDSMDSAARTEARHSLQVLRKNRTRMAEWVGSMKQSTNATWNKMKSGVTDAFSTLQKSWKDAEVETTGNSI